MSKPDDIPDDVWDAAREANSEHMFRPAPERIARAIMAERERNEQEIARLQTALVRIAFKDWHRRIVKPRPDGGIRGPGGMLAVWCLIGVNGSFVGDAKIAEKYPGIVAAIRKETP